jgi:serine/threonine protein kinase
MPLEQVYTALSGNFPVPWELDRIAPDDASGSELWRAAEKLPAARSFVLACLNRDPEKRPPVASLVMAWGDVIADALAQ